MYYIDRICIYLCIFRVGDNTPTGCESHEVECGDGTCIPSYYMCDGYDDCNDDEAHCKNISQLHLENIILIIIINTVIDQILIYLFNFCVGDNTPTGCTSGQTECGDGDCIPDAYVCDGITDCNDDETNCKNNYSVSSKHILH